MCQPTRRGFLVGCSAAIASLAGSRFNSFAFAEGGGGYNDEILVVVFLRGGQDGLNLVVPTGGASNDRQFYEIARPNLRVPPSGSGGALPLGTLGSTSFGLHPAAGGLHDLYQSGKLAVVTAAGMAANERSHFDSMNWIELGTPGVSNSPNGWLTRHLASATNLPDEIIMPSLSVGGLQAMSLLASYDTINLSSLDSFSLQMGPWPWRSAQRTALRHLYTGGGSWLHQTGLQALDAADIIELYADDNYTPANGAVYPQSWFGENLRTIAQMTKLDLGLRIATLDLGGWDTHENQGNNGGGMYSGLVDELSSGLAAFYLDLDGVGPAAYTQRLTVVVMSEFGRRFEENGDGGTDHGHGNNMLVLSGNALGGLKGSWPGLADGQLADGDLAVTTDFRRVLSEILIRRLGNPALSTIFPGYTGYSPLGVVAGTDLPVDASVVFADGLESGNFGAWSNVVP
ncbi:MAG: DUF1501 domain-containing protein [Thermoanaerobaculia bacterium]